MTAPTWEPIESECVYGEFLLRVSRTHSPSRVRWCVVPLVEVKKRPRWFTVGKGASLAEAKGYSATFERAQTDAIAMANAIVKSEEAAKGKRT
jgi:hypothetical protein